MFRPSWKYVLVGAIAVLALTTVSQSYACCGWGNGYGYGSGYGCGYGCNSCGWNCGYTPACCTVSYAPCCGDCALGCRPGPVRRLVLGPCKWYGGCCGYGYGCGCGGCYSSCCSGCLPYYTPTFGCCGAGVVPNAAVSTPSTGTPTPATKPVTPPAAGESPVPGPVTPGPAVPAPATPAAPATPTTPVTGAPTLDNSALLTVWVPYEAKITINGLPTTSTGSRRQYVSYGLQPGYNYKYVVHAEIVRDGKIVEEDQTVTLTAGEQGAAAFGFNLKTESVAAAD